MDESYGKFPPSTQQIVMEYSLFAEHLANYLPDRMNTIPIDLSAYADLLMYTLPSPRYSFYQVTDY